MTTSPTSTKHTPRIEDDALVRGTGRFMDDPRLPNTAYAAFVRSPHAHARVTSVNSDEARKAKKVLAVLTAEDMKAANVGSVSRHPPVPGLARWRKGNACRRSGCDGGRRDDRGRAGCGRPGAS